MNDHPSQAGLPAVAVTPDGPKPAPRGTTVGHGQPATPCPEGHYWGTSVRGGAPLHVRWCMLCRAVDFDELAEQLAEHLAPLRAENAELRRQLDALLNRPWRYGAQASEGGPVWGSGSRVHASVEGLRAHLAEQFPHIEASIIVRRKDEVTIPATEWEPTPDDAVPGSSHAREGTTAGGLSATEPAEPVQVGGPDRTKPQGGAESTPRTPDPADCPDGWHSAPGEVPPPEPCATCGASAQPGSGSTEAQRAPELAYAAVAEARVERCGYCETQDPDRIADWLSAEAQDEGLRADADAVWAHAREHYTDKLLAQGWELLATVQERDVARDELEAVRADLKATRNSRIVSVVFGHHKGAPRPFALQTPHRTLVALGAEFPDGAVAMRLANDDGWATRSEGGAESLTPDGALEIVWLSDELEPLAEAEQRIEALTAELADLHAVVADAQAERDTLRGRVNELEGLLTLELPEAELVGGGSDGQ